MSDGVISSSSVIPVVVGGQTDSHGCSIDGGYTWCDSLKQCARPWETPCLASQNVVQPIVGAPDVHGCATSGGYQWCDPLQQCVRSWETPCPVPDAYGCTPSTGHSTWCDVVQKCIDPTSNVCSTGSTTLDMTHYENAPSTGGEVTGPVIIVTGATNGGNVSAQAPVVTATPVAAPSNAPLVVGGIALATIAGLAALLFS